MPAPVTKSVTTASATLVPKLTQGRSRSFVCIGRPDSDERLVFLSFGERVFNAASAAFWIAPKTCLVITRDDARWPLVNQGVYAKVAEGAAINVNIQEG